MIIDVAATKEKLMKSGRTMPGYARSKGIDPAKFPTYLSGGVKMPPDVAEILRADNLLVEVSSDAA